LKKIIKPSKNRAPKTIPKKIKNRVKNNLGEALDKIYVSSFSAPATKESVRIEQNGADIHVEMSNVPDVNAQLCTQLSAKVVLR
jgi:hypothetical protein